MQKKMNDPLFPIAHSHVFMPKNKSMHYLTSPIQDAADIKMFKRSISFDYYQQQHKKWHHLLYQFVFFSLGLLFLFLGIFIFFKTTNYVCGFYFSNCSMLKSTLNIFCFSLSASCFLVGFNIHHPETDSLHSLIGKVEKKALFPTKDLKLKFRTIFANISREWKNHPKAFWKKVIR